MTPRGLQLIDELISNVCPVCWHVCLLVMPLGVKAHNLQSSPQLLNPFIILRGPLFGGNFALTSISRMFLCLLYETTEGLLKHLFIDGDSSVITLQCFLTILEIGGING